MAAEAPVIRPHRRVSPRRQLGLETRKSKPSDLQHAMYQTLVRTDDRLSKPPRKYNIGEIALGSEKSFDTHDYDGLTIRRLEQEETIESIKPGVSYIARGLIDFTEEGEAVLQTATMDLNLGVVDPHAQRLLDTTLAGYEMVTSIVFGQSEEGEKYVRGVGETIAYLIPNPNWLTRMRLKRNEASGVLKGHVSKIDTVGTKTMSLQTKLSRLFPGKGRVEIGIGTKHPVFDSGPKREPTGGEPVEEFDEVLVPVEYRGERVMLAGEPKLVAFSERHKRSFAKERWALEQGLDLFDALRTNDKLQSVVVPNKREFDVSTPEKKGAVMRYLFAELNKKSNLLTDEQQDRLWYNVSDMQKNHRSFIFEDGDPMRDELDDYFREKDPESLIPKLSEAMTPEQLLGEIFTMASLDSNPPPLNKLITLIDQYQGQFPKDVSDELIRAVLYTRIDQVQTETNPDAAITSLLEVLPYLKSEKNEYSAKWLAHLIDTSTKLFTNDPNHWGSSRELSYLMQQSVSGLITSIYGDAQYLAVDYNAIFALVPYRKLIGEWPQVLPFGLGENEGLAYLRRDLGLINLSREGEDAYTAPRQADLQEEQSEPESPEDDGKLQSAVDR